MPIQGYYHIFVNMSTEEIPQTGKHNKILIGIIIAIITGFFTGGFLPAAAVHFKILGTIFLNLLMMIVVPLVILSIIVGITNLGDIRKVGTIGRRTVLYYFATTAISVLIGIIMVNIIQPGKGIVTGENHPEITYRLSGEEKNILVIPEKSIRKQSYNENYIVTLSDQKAYGSIEVINEKSISVTKWNVKNLKDTGKGIEISLPIASKIKGKEKRDVTSTIKEMLVGNRKVGREGIIPRNIFNAMMRMDILPLIMFSLIFGAALSVLGEKGRMTLDVISVLNDAVHKIVDWIMVTAPVGIFGIIAARIGEAGGFQGFLPELIAVGKYSLTVVLGLSIHGLIILPLILFLLGKRNPFKFIAGMASALLNAFSTASSSATLPLTMENAERANKISKRTSSFVLPIGATVNMDGTALYEAVAAIFISQVYGIQLGMMEQSVIFITATLAAIGAAGIPEAGLVTMVIVLKAVGLPIEGIGLILSIDWLLDRFRTTVNVWGRQHWIGSY